MFMQIGRVTVFLAAFAAFLTINAQALAQESDAELRRENQRLQTQVRDLETDLKAARDRIDELEEDVQRLRRQLASARKPSTLPPLPTDEVSIDESDPAASPRALINAVQANYGEALGELEAGSPGDSENAVYIRELRSWVAVANRQFQSRIKWHVRVEDMVAGRRAYEITAIAVDPKTGAKLGAPFSFITSRTLARRMEEIRQRGKLDEPLVLTGVVRPNIAINSERRQRGPFDHPHFLGPYAEMTVGVEAQSVIPASEVQDKDADSGA